MPSRRLRIAIVDHNYGSKAFVQAIHAAGHELVTDAADVLLIDFDPPLKGYRDMIDKHSRQGAKVVLYPHGAGGPNLSYDGLWKPYERVDANLVNGYGHAEFLRRLEYPAPVHVVGWTRGEKLPFRPRDVVEHVVFGPLHPNADGSMAKQLRDSNTAVFEKLVKGPWRLTVRHVGTLEQIGLKKIDGVTYVDGRTSPLHAEIDVADAVVAGEGTFPNLAIAHGVGTVIYSQAAPFLGLPGEKPVKLRRPDRYRDYIRYPFDVADGPLDEIVHAAARSDAPIAHWRRRFQGEPMDPRAVVSAIEGIVAGEAPVRIDPTRRFTTLTFADELVERPELLRSYVEQVSSADDASLLVCAPGLD
ncbi:MAG: hypothetical protein QOJ07_2828, partial [Thermoleophilaceae bacterium]|nr:hypothetical protein [Thermoleophilaceae bacterium]